MTYIASSNFHLFFKELKSLGDLELTNDANYLFHLTLLLFFQYDSHDSIGQSPTTLGNDKILLTTYYITPLASEDTLLL